MSISFERRRTKDVEHKLLYIVRVDHGSWDLRSKSNRSRIRNRAIVIPTWIHMSLCFCEIDSYLMYRAFESTSVQNRHSKLFPIVA